jgi:hypothetical protein
LIRKFEPSGFDVSKDTINPTEISSMLRLLVQISKYKELMGNCEYLRKLAF